MRILLILSTLLVLLSAGCGDVSPVFPVPSPSWPFSVSGVVRSTEDQQGVPAAIVSAAGSETTTDQEGRYFLEGLSATGPVVTVTVEKAGYLPASVNVYVRPGELVVQDIPLTPEPAVSGERRASGRVDFAAGETVAPPAFRASSAPSLPAPLSVTEPTSVIVELAGELTMERALWIAGETGSPGYRIYPRIGRLVLELPPDLTLEAFMLALAERPDVAGVEPNGPVWPLAVYPNDPLWAANRAPHDLIRLPPAWGVVGDAKGVTVAVIDTGIREDHPDLAGAVVSGWDFADDDFDPTDPGKNAAVGSHGTHVAGIIGALANNGKGSAGVAWNAKLLNVRVIGSDDRAEISDVAEGIWYAVDAGADIINLSLGGNTDSSDLREAVRYAASRGVVPVAATGNDGMRNVLYPARYPEVIAVGSAASASARSASSNYGPEVDLVAPGEGILSANYDGTKREYNYAHASGTSMAAPHVSGVIALMLASGIPRSQVREILKETAIRSAAQSETHSEERGYGLVNAYGAVTGARPSRALLFALDQDFRVVSAVSQPDLDRRFSLAGLPASAKLHLVAWLDVDHSSTVEPGDYTAIVEISTLAGDAAEIYVPLDIHESHRPETKERIERALEKIGAGGD